MRKAIFSIMSAALMLLTACGQDTEQQKDTRSAQATVISEVHNDVTSVPEQTIDISYNIQDIRNLQDFLLTRPTEDDLTGKPYDLDNDGVWSVFDLCLMKRAYLNEHQVIYSIDFDIERGTVMLNSGYEMPVLGIGTYRLSQSEAENFVYWALADGYRLIDTARIYGNEEGVGKGIQRAIDDGICTRDEIFITTKMWTSDYNDGENAIQASLDRLGLDYIDLMILHHSQPSNDITAYYAMEQAVADGKLRSIGLSNYYEPEDFDRVVDQAIITPALLQNETHPYHQSGEMKEHIAKYGTVLESWYPLGGRGNTQRLFDDETISAIASAHGKTSAQVILRWHLQAGQIAIPGSSNEAHIKENCEIFDFSLSDEEMQKMAALEKSERFSTY